MKVDLIIYENGGDATKLLLVETMTFRFVHGCVVNATEMTDQQHKTVMQIALHGTTHPAADFNLTDADVQVMARAVKAYVVDAYDTASMPVPMGMVIEQVICCGWAP